MMFSALAWSSTKPRVKAFKKIKWCKGEVDLSED
jgi:hypothetical protein